MLDLLAVQGTLKSLPQHHSSKASILRRSAFFTVQLSHPYMTTGQTMVGAMTVMATFFKRTYAHTILFSAPDPQQGIVDPGLHQRLLATTGESGSVSHWPLKSNSLGVLIPLPDPQVGKSVVGPRAFLTVQEFVWYHCSAACGSSARWLYGGANGNFLPDG